jgi:O-antigen ligase
MNFIELWGKGIFLFLCVSVVLLGIGRIEVPLLNLRFSAWSVSRTTLFFWLLWKLTIWIRARRGPWEGDIKGAPISVLLFVGIVGASVLSKFDHFDDYRYFLFAFGHYLMILNIFQDERRQFLLYYLLGTTPGFLLLRGVITEPSVLSLSLGSRFAYPLDHANTAGYLFAMSIPLALVIVVRKKLWLRLLAGLSLLGQFTALTLTFSRTAWIACGTALFSSCIVARRLRAFVAVVAIVGLVGLGASSEIRERVWSLTDALKDPRVIWRVEVMAAAITVGLDKPVLGNGYGRGHLRAALTEKRPEFVKQQYVSHTHNLYTELVSGVGLLGLVIFLWVLGSAARQSLQGARTEMPKDTSSGAMAIGLFGSLVAFIVGGLGDVAFYHHETRIFFFTLLALIHLRKFSAPRPIASPAQPDR